LYFTEIEGQKLQHYWGTTPFPSAFLISYVKKTALMLTPAILFSQGQKASARTPT